MVVLLHTYTDGLAFGPLDGADIRSNMLTYGLFFERMSLARIRQMHGMS